MIFAWFIVWICLSLSGLALALLVGFKLGQEYQLQLYDPFAASNVNKNRLADPGTTRMHPNVGDIYRWKHPTDRQFDHRWKVLGIHLGGENIATGKWTESVIHVENISHEPAWTGEWETHVGMYIPECLLSNSKIESKGTDR